MLPSTASSRTRSSSIPRQYHRNRDPSERFNVADAVQLKLRLQNLDKAILNGHSILDMDKIGEACRSRPFHETVAPYVDGSETFYLLVKRISRPDLIPDVYFQAYRAVLDRRPYTNTYKVSDFKKDVDPTFSEIRPFLKRIDVVCETDLDGAFGRLESEVKPFPFIRLPAELRLQVYSHLLPRDAHIAPLHHLSRHLKSNRLRLDIMRVNRQLHDEVRKYFYENRTLFIIFARDKASQNLSNQYMSQYLDAIAAMSLATRQLFKTCEIQVSYLSSETQTAGRLVDEPPSIDPVRQIFRLLPDLVTLIVSFGAQPFASLGVATHRVVLERLETVCWLVERIPKSIDVKWDLTNAFNNRFSADEQPLRSIMETRGSIQIGASVFARQVPPAERNFLRR